MEENAAIGYTSLARMLNQDYGQDCEKMALASNSDGSRLEDTHREFGHFDLEGPWRLDESL
jgi:hypothetical protein